MACLQGHPTGTQMDCADAQLRALRTAEAL